MLEIALGIATSIGGFLEVGSIATAAQAGAAYGFQLVWAIALGTVCLIFLIEMSGRLAAVSHHTIADAMRERFGFNFFLVPLLGVLLVSLLVLAAEIGGVCLGLQLLTGVGLAWWALPVGALAWLLLWKGTFGIIEKGTSFFGLVTLAFVVAAVMSKPNWGAVLAGAVPTLPSHDGTHYWFLAVSILGASITPYLFYFYSSGAVEDGWKPTDLKLNRFVAGLGISFGGVLAIAVLVVAAMVFQPRGIRVEQYEQAALLLVQPLGFAGFVLFAASLAIACFGAALEITLALAYLVAQGFGWAWGENKKPREAARFATVYTVMLLLATLIAVTGIEPMKMTLLSMALTAATLPIAVVPFLILMNDRHYLGKHVNGWLGNTVVVFVITLAFVLAIISVPLQILGS